MLLMSANTETEGGGATCAVPPRAVYFDTKDAARLLGLHPDTLRRLRRVGGGPRYVKIGRAIRYRSDDVDSWAASRTFASTADEAARCTG